MKKIISLLLCFVLISNTICIASPSKVFEEYGKQIADNFINSSKRHKQYQEILKNKKSTIAEKTEACFGLNHVIHPTSGKLYYIADIYKHDFYTIKNGFYIQFKNGKYTFYIKENNKYKMTSIKTSDVILVESDNANDGMYMELTCETCNKKDRKVLYLPKGYKFIH